MTYVTSDIHGNLDALLDLLDAIEIQPDYLLYILGDVVDRGPYGPDILLYLADHPQLQLLLGNHEITMMKHYTILGMRDTSILQYNMGIQPTHDRWYELSVQQRAQCLSLLANCFVQLDVTINTQRYILVHGTAEHRSIEQIVWDRYERDSTTSHPDAIVIVGHTPVQHYGQSSIFHGKGWIDLDCGLMTCNTGRLGCLRLDDLQEFYVD